MSKRANRRAIGPVLTSGFLAVLNRSLRVKMSLLAGESYIKAAKSTQTGVTEHVEAKQENIIEKLGTVGAGLDRRSHRNL